MITFQKILKTNLPRYMGFGQVWRFCSDDDFKKQTKVQVTNENAQ